MTLSSVCLGPWSSSYLSALTKPRVALVTLIVHVTGPSRKHITKQKVSPTWLANTGSFERRVRTRPPLESDGMCLKSSVTNASKRRRGPQGTCASSARLGLAAGLRPGRTALGPRQDFCCGQSSQESSQELGGPAVCGLAPRQRVCSWPLKGTMQLVRKSVDTVAWVL